MKVNISYSVELEEVLENVRHLFLKSEENLRDEEEHFVRVLKGEYNDENLGEVVKTIHEYKETLAKFDLKLGEMTNILMGYYQLKYQPEQMAGQEAPHEEPNKEEE